MDLFGQFADERAVAWESCAAAWLDSLAARSGAGHTADAYRRDVRQFVDYAMLPPWDVRRAHALAWRAALVDLGRQPATVNRKMAALTSLYAFASRYPDPEQPIWSRGNPFDGPDLRHAVSPYDRATWPTLDEVNAILARIPLNTATDLRNYALLAGLFLTTRRAAEWLSLRWGDLHPEGDICWFRYRCKGGRTVRQTMTPHLWHHVRTYLLASESLPLGPDDYLFVPLEQGHRPASARPGRPLSARYAADVLRRYGSQAGVARDRLHLHGLRHAGASLRNELGMPLVDLSQFLAHRSVATTQIYLHNALSKPADAFAGAVDDMLTSGLRRRLEGPVRRGSSHNVSYANSFEPSFQEKG